MTNEDKINNLIKRYKYVPGDLAKIINERKIGIEMAEKERMKEYEKLKKYDVEVLEKALREIKKSIIWELIVKLTPVAISLYFIVFETRYLKQDIISGACLENIYIFIATFIKSIIIFFIFPIAYMEKIVNHFLKLETEYFSVGFFYKIMYWTVGILMTIKLFESIF